MGQNLNFYFHFSKWPQILAQVTTSVAEKKFEIHYFSSTYIPCGFARSHTVWVNQTSYQMYVIQDGLKTFYLNGAIIKKLSLGNCDVHSSGPIERKIFVLTSADKMSLHSFIEQCGVIYFLQIFLSTFRPYFGIAGI